MQPLRASRRQLLTLAGLTLGVAVVDLAGPAGPASAEPTTPAAGDGPVLQPIADTPVAALFGDGSAPVAAPRQLAVRVARSADLPAGTRIAVTFDPHRYVPLTPAVATLAGRPLAAEKTVLTDPGTGQQTSAIILTEDVPARGDLVIVVGTAHPLLYPHDLGRHASTPTADLRETPAGPRSQRPLRPSRPPSYSGPALPWGVEVDAVWGGQRWGDNGRYHYPVPVRVSLRSTGPGPAPESVSFAVALDPRLVSSVEVTSAQLNNRPWRGRIRQSRTSRTASMLEAVWQVPLRLRSGDVLDVYLTVDTVVPRGELAGLKHPVVSLLPSGAEASQRLTGRETLTRTDAICATVADG